MMLKSPVRLLRVPSVVEAKHDGKGARRQQLLGVVVIVVVEAVGRCQGKSVANLFDNDSYPYNQIMILHGMVWNLPKRCCTGC